MAKVNISIPDDLKARMGTFPELNWSEVARKAFENQLIISDLKGKDMQASGIERLKASKLKNVDRVRAEGHNLGKEWALEEAEYEQVERVAGLECGGEWNAPGAMKWLAEAIDENDDYWRIADRLFGRDDPSDELVEGFIEGVKEVFSKL